MLPRKIFIMILLLSLGRKLDIDSVQSKEIAKKTFLMLYFSCCLLWILCVVLKHSDGLELNCAAGLHDTNPNKIQSVCLSCYDEEEAS